MVNARQQPVLRRRVETYLDGEANPTLAACVRRHLAECWACSEDAEWLFLIKTALCQLGEHPPQLAVAQLTQYASTPTEAQ